MPIFLSGAFPFYLVEENEKINGPTTLSSPSLKEISPE